VFHAPEVVIADRALQRFTWRGTTLTPKRLSNCWNLRISKNSRKFNSVFHSVTNTNGLGKHPKPLVLLWWSQRDSNPCYRSERPSQSAFHLILLSLLGIKSRLEELKAVKKAVRNSLSPTFSPPDHHPPLPTPGLMSPNTVPVFTLGEIGSIHSRSEPTCLDTV
jgi:hypothetical protein